MNIFGFIAMSAALLSLPVQAEELTGTLKRIKDNGAITLGVRETSVPFSYLDGAQQVVGYSSDICRYVTQKIAQKLDIKDLQVRKLPVTTSSRIPLVMNGTYDLECASTTNNVDRAKQVAFSYTHFLTASRFVAKKEAKLGKIEDLSGKRIALVSGTTNATQFNLANNERKLGATTVNAKDVAEAFLMVETGRADAFVMDDVVLANLVSSSKDPAAYVVSSDAFSKPEPYGLLMRLGDEPFKKAVDDALADLYSSGEVVKIYEKWFTQAIPPRGINVNLPLSGALRKAFEHPSDSPNPDDYAG